MSQFTRPLDIRKVEGTEYWTLQSEVVYHVGEYPSEEIITVPAGRKTDLGSKPRFSWLFVGHPLDEGAQAYVVHDELMEHPANGLAEGAKPRSRRRCDQIFLEALKVLGVSWWKRSTMYFAVRVGERGVWEKYRKKDEARRIAELCKAKWENG